jgi:hypothetical protein
LYLSFRLFQSCYIFFHLIQIYYIYFNVLFAVNLLSNLGLLLLLVDYILYIISLNSSSLK